MALVLGWPAAAATGGVAHALDVTLDSATGSLQVVDQLTFHHPTRETPVFALHRALEPAADRGRLESVAGDDPLLRHYRVILDEPVERLTLRYGGTIGTSAQTTMGGMPRATLGPNGVYLDGASAWYPRFADPIPRFELSVKGPADWLVVSQGARAGDGHSRWSSTTPQDDIYLIAAPFRHYGADAGGVALSVYLLEDDPQLARRYLEVMGGYIELYADLIGAYPYAKFAVVENRWQTGFGMPSFTLLGSRVLRLPFIPYTSLPHEILHNWWGNGVWVDYDAGNWSEGLTAYLSDHLMKELRGQGERHRLSALERYANFAAAGRDFPLLEFTARHDDASQAVGYSKSLMLVHMLRRDLGDDAFRAGLARLWQRHRFSRIGFETALDSLTDGGAPLDYRPWLERTGAPRLVLEDARVKSAGDTHSLRFTLRQAQSEAPFPIRVPVAVTLEGAATSEVRTVTLTAREQAVAWNFERRPLRLDVDPAHDVMRLLDPRERPPSLGLLFGAPRQWLVIPAAAPEAEREAWREFAEHWRRRFGNVAVTTDAEAPPADAQDAVWLLGWDNRLRDGPGRHLEGHHQGLAADAATIDGERHDAGSRAVVLVAPAMHRHRVGFIGARSPAAIRALGGKLPHYGGYGRLVFTEDDAANLLKQHLEPADPPLVAYFDEARPPLRLPGREALTASPFER